MQMMDSDTLKEDRSLVHPQQHEANNFVSVFDDQWHRILLTPEMRQLGSSPLFCKRVRIDFQHARNITLDHPTYGQTFSHRVTAEKKEPARRADRNGGNRLGMTARAQCL
jgi:hypothetical protein